MLMLVSHADEKFGPREIPFKGSLIPSTTE